MMHQNWQTILIEGFVQMSGWEITAAMLGVGYILLAAKTSQWCWLFAFISTLIYTILFWEGQLPMQAVLNFYYMGMAIYGFQLWQKHGQVENGLAIITWGWQRHVLFTGIGLLISGLIGYYLITTQSSQQPWLDATVTVFSLMNTWLMARKVLENWLYWIVIDIASAALYFNTAYYATTLLFTIYTILAVSGFISWLKIYKVESQAILTQPIQS
jgi:nicotinamide mononucleotide transporter